MITEQHLLDLLNQVSDCLSAAMRIAEVMVKHASLPVSKEFIERMANLGHHESSHVPKVLKALEMAGFCMHSAEGTWIASADPVDLGALSMILRGASLYNQVHQDKDEILIVLTMPELPSRLIDVLPHQGPYYAKLGATDSAFMKIAREANSRLVIVTPFIDGAGAEWITKLFRLTSESVEKILILRDYDTFKNALLNFSEKLDGMQVKIFDYFIRHEERLPPYETFHAKLVLGDDTQAYVGSANMLASSLEIALEVGTLIKGKSVLDIRRLIDSMLEVSKRIC